MIIQNGSVWLTDTKVHNKGRMHQGNGCKLRWLVGPGMFVYIPRDKCNDQLLKQKVTLNMDSYVCVIVLHLMLEQIWFPAMWHLWACFTDHARLYEINLLSTLTWIKCQQIV